jgi:hypothetical protein
MGNSWDFLWPMFSAFVFVGYLFVMFQVIADLFRDDALGGFGKALWIVGLVLLPFLTALVYVVARGSGMARRHQAAAQRFRSEVESRSAQPAAKSPADQIADAKRLLDAGTITADEFARMKAMALA